MAEINVEKKKPFWPWIIGILAILLVIFLVFIFIGTEDDDRESADDQIEQIDQFETVENTDLSYPDNAIGAYLHLVEDGYDEKLGEEQDYTRLAMDKLATAVEQKAYDLGDRPSEELQGIGSRLRERDETRETREARVQTDEIKRNGETIVNSLEELQEKHFPEIADELQELRSDVDAIDLGTQAEEQSNAITSFFKQAAEVLREMPAETSTTTVPYDRTYDTTRYSTDVDTIELE